MCSDCAASFSVRLTIPYNMATLDRDMIKQAVCMMVDKVIDERIGGAGDIEVSCF